MNQIMYEHSYVLSLDSHYLNTWLSGEVATAYLLYCKHLQTIVI